MTTAMTIKNSKAAAQLDELLKDYRRPEDILGESVKHGYLKGISAS